MHPSARDHRPLRIERLRGRLHELHEVRSPEGKLLGFASKAMNVEVHAEDLVQLAGGALALALPAAMTGEVWELGASLSTGRMLLIALASVATLVLYVWALFYRHHVQRFGGAMVLRITAAYSIALGMSFLVLLLLDKAPLDDLATALRRTVLVCWPATISATTVDWLR